jgi:hypothetical protein
MMPRAFNWTAVEASLGPAVVEAARRVVDEAPPLSPEQRAKLRAVFTSAPARKTTRQAA